MMLGADEWSAGAIRNQQHGKCTDAFCTKGKRYVRLGAAGNEYEGSKNQFPLDDLSEGSIACSAAGTQLKAWKGPLLQFDQTF
jgi:hypothetical protein